MSRTLKKIEMLKYQKSCPFCGKNDMLELTVHEDNVRPACKYNARIVCLNCFASVCTHGFYWREEVAEDEVIKAWNRRITYELS